MHEREKLMKELRELDIQKKEIEAAILTVKAKVLRLRNKEDSQ